MHVVWTYLKGSGVPHIYRFEVTQDQATPTWALDVCDWD
jgi:hypothetical protein